MRKGRPALVLVAAMLTVAGCGSSSKSSSSTPVSNAGAKATTSSQASATPATNAGGAGQALSTSELVVQADAICKQLSTELDAPKSPIRTQADIARVAPQRAALEQRAVTELSKLKPPASMARDYQEIIEARQTLVEDLTKIGEAVASNKPQAEQPIYESSATLVRKMRATAQHRGFKECGDLG